MLWTLFFLATALGGVSTALMYWRLRRKELAAYKVLLYAQGEDIRPSAQAYWRLDSLAKRWALANMANFIVVVVANAWAQASGTLNITLLVLGAGSMAAMSIVATIFNDKEFEARIEAPYGRF